MNRIPVIIAAHNEEAYIGRTLDRLDASMVEPIVAINGTTDRTRQIAEGYGATIVEREEQGKLPVVQEALQTLGERALGPVLYTDADSYPYFPSKWGARLVLQLATHERPATVAGPVLYCDGNRFDNIVRSSMRVVRAVQTRNQATYHEIFGSNMASRFANHPTLDAVLAIPHVWPGEDRAITHEVVEQGGAIDHIIDPRAVVMTSARYHMPLRERLGFGGDRAAVHQQMLNSYYDRSAPDVEARFIDGAYEPVAGHEPTN